MPAGLQSTPLNICIVGGGFGGLYTALYLQKYRHLQNSRITLIEPNDQFVFFPMMYELITDELKQWELFPTYSRLLAGTTVQWQQAHAESIDLEQQTVSVSSGETFTYDYLVMATGAKSRPMNIPGLDEHAQTFRSFHDALILNERLASLVRAQAVQPSTDGMEPISVTAVGGGASGVELACKVADYLGDRGIVTLVEHGSRLLSSMPKGIRRQANRALAKRQVNVRLETSVSSIGADTVTLKAGDATATISSQLTLWAVGTQPQPWLGTQPVKQNDYGQRATRRTLQLVDYDNVFVLGDSADVRGPKGNLAPNTAQAAFQAASKVAENLAAMTKGKSPKPFNYLHLGDMITLGVGDAGLHSFGITLGGQLAAVIRRGVYVFRMPTLRHQFKVGRRALADLFRALLPPWGNRSHAATFSQSSFHRNSP
ncbi:MAG: NAD(P)/FAD-dependent oxidoreductase [Cyanobacteria bacterium J06629_19]